MIRPAVAVLFMALLPLFSGVSLAQPSRAGSQQRLKELSLEELANVEITIATKQPESALDTPAAIHVITRDDIRRSGAVTLPDALRLAPGVIVNQSDANRWAVGIRGFADVFSKNVLVLIDGRSVYTPLVGGVHWAIQDVVLADVERIEVIRGPGGAVWGANSVNGVINVVTRSAAETHGLRVTAATGNVERGRVAARYGGAVRGVDFRVHAKAFNRAAQFHADGSKFDQWESAQGGFRADWRGGERDRFTVSGDLYKTEVGERAEVSFFSPPSSRNIDGRLDLTGGNLIFVWEREPRSGGMRTRLQTYYDRTNRQGFTFSEVRDTFDADFNVQLPQRGAHRVSAGINTRLSPSTVTQIVPTLNFLPSQRTHTLASGFLYDDVSVVENRVSVAGGLKVEYNSYTGVELLPSIQGIWTLHPDQRLWASVRRSVRTPSRFERDLAFKVLLDPATPLYLAIEGSDDFRSESVLGAELGYRVSAGKNFYLDVAAFHNTYDGIAGLGDAATSISSEPIAHVAVTLPFVNSVDGDTHGVEVAPDWKPLSFWRVSGSYTYLRLSLGNKPGFTNTALRDNYLGMSPRHQVRLQSRVDLRHRLEFDQTYRYVGRLKSWDLPGYHALDLRLGWQATPHVTLALAGQNLLDEHHAEFGAVPVQIRRSAYLQLTLAR